jgi:ribonuclease Z
VSSVALRLPSRGEVWLFDGGEGTQHQLIRSELKSSQLRRIFVTHMHGDHIFGLPGLMASIAMSSAVQRLDIYGPASLSDYVASCLEHSDTHLNYPFTFHEARPGVVFSDADYEVTCSPLAHRIPAVGYAVQERDRPGQFDAARAQAMGIEAGPIYRQLKAGETVRLDDGRVIDGTTLCGPTQRGRKVVYCTDTMYCQSAVELARGADVLIHEATFATSEAHLATKTQHSTASMAARVASEAGVKKLIITHFSARYAPGNPVTLDDVLAEAQAIFPNTMLARDFLVYDI